MSFLWSNQKNNDIYKSTSKKFEYYRQKKQSILMSTSETIVSVISTPERTKNSDVALRSLFPPPMVTSLSCESRNIAIGTNKPSQHV